MHGVFRPTRCRCFCCRPIRNRTDNGAADMDGFRVEHVCVGRTLARRVVDPVTNATRSTKDVFFFFTQIKFKTSKCILAEFSTRRYTRGTRVCPFRAKNKQRHSRKLCRNGRTLFPNFSWNIQSLLLLPLSFALQPSLTALAQH